MRRGSRRRTLVVSGLILALGTAPSAAHPGHKRSSRLVQVDLSTRPAVLKYGYVFDDASSDAARKLADRDADGSVSQREGDAELQRLGQELLAGLTICRGSAPALQRCSAPAPSAVVASSATAWQPRPGKPLSLTWELNLEISAEDRVFELRDNVRRSDIDRTDATLLPPTDARVTTTTTNGGSTQADNVLLFDWAADQAPRRLALAWAPPMWGNVVALSLALAGVAIAMALLWLSKRRATSVA